VVEGDDDAEVEDGEEGGEEDEDAKRGAEEEKGGVSEGPPAPALLSEALAALAIRETGCWQCKFQARTAELGRARGI
jgi:hypothetical protein